jgi:hypothetical protein
MTTELSPEWHSREFFQLLNDAATFGADFDQGGDQEAVSKALQNLGDLKARLLSCISGIGALLETAEEAAPGACVAVWFLADMVQDLDRLEGHLARPRS